MKRLNEMSASNLIKLFFAFLTLCLFLTAVILPDRGSMLKGTWQIMCSTVKAPSNVFDIGGFSGSFLNAGLVCLVCTLLFFLPKATANSGSVLGFLLTMAFTFWGVNLFNLFIGMIGVALYCAVKRLNPSARLNVFLFSTALAPLYSDLLFRYPDSTNHGFSWLGLLLALPVGIAVGFFLQAGLENAPKLHKNFTIYSAALPLGFTAFFLRVVLYTIPNVTVPPTPENAHAASSLTAAIFCGTIFAVCILVGVLMGGSRSFWSLLHDDGHTVDFSRRYSTAAFLMNVGTYGAFILLTYFVIGAEFNAITLGCVFAMLASCCSGTHVGNVWPLPLGYIIISAALRLIIGDSYELVIHHQTVVIGLCFTNCLSPIVGKYGWPFGIVAAMMHYCLVSQVPALHGGFLLYNGGFTSALVCVMLLPILEHFFKTKSERKAKKVK